MKFIVSLVLVVISSAAVAETRCGWIQNPTPANYWLTDAEGTWVMAVQGGFQAEGIDNLVYPDPDQYVETNGSYGYYCGCVNATTSKKTMTILKIKSASAKKLSACLKDPNLPTPP